MKKTILTIVTFISLLFTTALVSANYNFTAKDTQLINALTQKVEQVISEKGERFRTPLVEGINKLSLQYKKNTRVSNILKQVSNNIDNSFEKDFEKILGNVKNIVNRDLGYGYNIKDGEILFNGYKIDNSFIVDDLNTLIIISDGNTMYAKDDFNIYHIHSFYNNFTKIIGIDSKNFTNIGSNLYRSSEKMFILGSFGYKQISGISDINSFKLLGKDSAYPHRHYIYGKDNNKGYIIEFIDNESKIKTVSGSNFDYLGSFHAKINGNIYFLIDEIIGADSNTYKITQHLNDDTSIGLSRDKNNSYEFSVETYLDFDNQLYIIKK